jgi:hypothetical protein
MLQERTHGSDTGFEFIGFLPRVSKRIPSQTMSEWQAEKKFIKVKI